jgi:very-short-patch-repair endonuclease
MTGYQFRRQVPIGRYIADFVCPILCARGARLIVEIDGGQHDRSSPREAERSGFLQNQGYRILRFWNNEVLANIDGVHETIAEELGRLTPTQTLPHRGGGLQGENNVHSNDTEGPRLAPVRPVCYTARLNQIRTPWWPLNQTPAPRPKKSPAVSSCWRCWRRS